MAGRSRAAQWTRFHLHINSGALEQQPDHEERSATFNALGDGLEFWMRPLEQELEITGPAAARLTVARLMTMPILSLSCGSCIRWATTSTFISRQDPDGCPGFGWLRASHRKTTRSAVGAWRPWHTHDEHEPLTPGEPVEVDVEIWPTSVIIPVGYRLGVSVQGRDFELPGDGPWPKAFGVTMRGHGIFVHDEQADRPADTFGGQTTVIAVAHAPATCCCLVIPR